MNDNTIKSIRVLLLGMLAGGVMSVLFGKELCWDLANYHFYLPYVFFHTRAGIDYWPTSFVHQFLNPTIDFATYFLINDFSPILAEFILGAIHGINFWLLFLLARIFLQSRTIIPLILAGLGMYGPVAFPGIGSFQNDNLVSIFVLGAVLAELKLLQLCSSNSKCLDNISPHFIVISGLLLGIGFGLKFTAGIFVAGMLFATLLLPFPLRTRAKLVVIWSAAFLMGLLLSAGHWMYLMWQQHGNPLFPFLNNIFHSPDFSATNWRDTRFLPQGIWQQLFFPFYFAWDGRTADVPFRDFRLAVLYVLFVMAALKALLQKKSRTTISQAWLFIFYIISYSVWQYYFSIARYFVALEMLAPLTIYLLVCYLIKNKYFLTMTLILLLCAIPCSMHCTKMIRAPWYGATYFDVQLPASVAKISNALVFMAYSAYALDLNPRPQSYLIAYFPPGWHFVGVPFLHEKYFSDAKLTNKIFALLRDQQTPIFLLTSDHNMPAFYQAVAKFGLVATGRCEKIFSDRQRITYEDVLLCPVKLMVFDNATRANS